MKTLLLVRHAKSSWGDLSLKDFDRPLNDRGRRDAPDMAKRLVNKQVKIDAFIASPAKRARKTAELFVEEFGRDKKEIIFRDALYLATPNTFEEVISAVDDRYDHIAVFSHNDGITSFANRLTKVQIDDMPTCGIFAVWVNVNSWSGFPGADKEFWFFDYPKAVVE